MPVALPAYACYDVATAADTAGVPFLLYDLDPTTLGPDFDSLRRALRAGADRVVVVHLYGLPVDMREVSELAREFGTLVIEDAAQGAGGSFEGIALGGLGPLGVLSFGRGKGNTAGRGGALLVQPEAERWVEAQGPLNLLPAAVGLRDWLALLAQWALGRPSLYWLPASVPFLALGDTIYRAPHEPAAISGMAAAVLDRTLPLGPAEAEMRRENASRLKQALRGTRLRTPEPSARAQPGYLRLPVIQATDRPPPGRDTRALGIMPGYPRALADLDGFGTRRQNRGDDFPGARQLAARLWTLPTHSALVQSDFIRLESWCQSIGSK
jgi:dTDP-4-amino-4,6-dideoxygalactose transaminase